MATILKEIRKVVKERLPEIETIIVKILKEETKG